MQIWLKGIALLLTLLVSATLSAHHPDGTAPSSADVVVARVYTDDAGRIHELGRNHQLWYYIWREQYAVILTDRDRLPPDATVDEAASASWHMARAPYRGTGAIPARPCYRTVEQTHTDLQGLVSENPQIAQWVDYGDSWEKTQLLGGYDLRALVLTNRSIAGPKPVFMVMSAIHARELATAESATRFAELLFNRYGQDADITWMLDYFEVHILPQTNPDGRKMAEAECTSGCSPNWRKNTNQDFCGAGSSLRGVDLNRNAGASFWGGPSSSGSQCSITYRGPSPSSEPETSQLEAYTDSRFPDYRDAPDNDFNTPADDNADGIFISIHSAGDIVFYPWEGINSDPPNINGLRSLAQKMGLSTTFAACQNCFLGPASGTNVDYVYEKLGIPSFTFEIGSSFGQSCSSFDSSVLPQTLAGLMTALKHTRRSYQSPLGPDVIDVLFTPGAGGGTLTATADDTRLAVNGGGEPTQPAQAIAQVRYTINEPPWVASESFALTAVDGVFDETAEDATVTLTSGQLAGASMIFVYAEDADGNTGPPSAVWVGDPGLDFESGFESQ